MLLDGIKCYYVLLCVIMCY